MEVDALQRCLKRYPEIVAAYLFGSAVSGKMTPMSDIDVALIVRDEATLDEILLLTSNIASDIQRLFHREGDVKVLNRIQRLPFLHEVLATGKLIVEREPEIHRRFIRRILTAYLDFQPVYEKCLRTYARSLQRGQTQSRA